jgi:hypothetical protein
VVDEIRAHNSYLLVSGMFLPTSGFRPATPSIFERNSMTLYREPTLIDLLNDPIVHLVMKADGVTKVDILDLYDRDEDDVAVDTLPAFICNGLLRTIARPEA